MTDIDDNTLFDEHIDLDAEEEPPDAEPELAAEPLFTALLRDVVRRQHPEDPVWRDIVELLASPISLHLAATQAKGGDFAAQKEEAGVNAGRYRLDQSLRSHLINGLFPILNLADHLKAWEAPMFRRWDDESRRLFVAAFLLHDWIKFPGVQAALSAAGITTHDPNPNLYLPIVESQFRDWIGRLGIDAFLEPLGGSEHWLHELIYLAPNTQVKWGTMLNQSALPGLHWAHPRRDLVMSLCTLADLFSYSAHTPSEVVHHPAIQTQLARLSDTAARLTFHHVTENRGVLTNLLHGALLDALTDEARRPLLYAPSGVVYLERSGYAPPLPSLDAIAERVTEKTQTICARQVTQQLPGFRSSPTGFRFPDFYWRFFDLPSFIEMTPRAAIRAIPFAKKDPFSEKRLTDADRKGFLPDDLDVSELPRNRRVDQLAELMQLWVRVLSDKRPTFATTEWLFTQLALTDVRNAFDQIVTGGATGGVAYNWYVAAAIATQRAAGQDDTQWEQWLQGHADALAAALRTEAPAASDDAWAELRRYAAQSIRLDDPGPATSADFAAELAQYSNAKRKGRGTTNVCSICAAAFPIKSQEEPAVLFAPAIYSNRLAVHGGKTQRDICAICSLEMMLRKLLMTHTQATGGAFEGRKERFLFFYPTYFFTPETLAMLRRLYRRLQKVSITALRKLVIGEANDRAEVTLDPATLQKLEDLLLAPRPGDQMAYDPLSRLHYPAHEPMMFDFIGIPPGRDASDTQSWVQPTLLALLLPLQLDVKVVASESSVPLFTDASDFDETALLDAPAAAMRHVLGTTRAVQEETGRDQPIAAPLRLTLDDITRQGRGAIQRLIVAYFVHTDAHARMGRTGFDYRWQQFPALARDLASTPLTLFAYLKQWQRSNELDGLPPTKVQQYLAYYHFFDAEETFDEGGVTMSHARRLTELYRQFYRAEGWKSNAILRPLTVAATAILDADTRLFGDGDAIDSEALTEVVWGEVQGFINRVRDKSAQGYAMAPYPEADAAVKAFAHYFVHDLFVAALKGDVAALRGRQLNLLKNACEVLYNEAETPLREARRVARAAKATQGDPTDDDYEPDVQ